MNNTIVVEMKEGHRVVQRIYTLDDYRVAVAICNLLDNMNFVNKQCTTYKEKKNEA